MKTIKSFDYSKQYKVSTIENNKKYRLLKTIKSIDYPKQ